MVISVPSCLVIGIVTLLIGSTKLVKSGHIMNDFDPRDNREDVVMMK